MFNKITFITLILVSFILTSFAQAPNQINYQGVARSSTGTPISNQLIAIRLSVHNSSSNGIIQYSETRSLTTDAEGLFNLQIGSAGATNTTGSWAAISWDNGTKYLQVEMDSAGGSSFLNLGTQQLVSVPYAQYCNLSGGLIPSATISPNQITASGATANQVLKFNGTHWVPGTISSGALTLPYSGSDGSLESFHITNTNTNGEAILGSSSGNSALSRGVLGFASGTGAQGVYGGAGGTSGIGVFGYTNTPSALSIKGQHSNGGVAINGTTNTTSSSVASILGECTGVSGIGVKGFSAGATGIGVYGESASGTGVKGYGNNVGSVAIFGSSLAGTGVMAYSFTGKALDVIGASEFNGNLKISGGSTNPSYGAVLTSDASGNATWKNGRVAFGARGINNSYNVMSHNVFQKVEFNVEDYDLAGSFLPTTGSLSSNTSVFTVPVSGVYNINSKLVVWVGSSFTNISFTEIRVQRLRAGTTATLLRSQGYINTNSSYDHSEPTIIADFHFQAGDKVWIEIRQANDDSDPATLGSSTNEDDVWFRASLIIAD